MLTWMPFGVSFCKPFNGIADEPSKRFILSQYQASQFPYEKKQKASRREAFNNNGADEGNRTPEYWNHNPVP